MSMIAKNRVKSAWTPLSNSDNNNKIFEERKGLIGKWYEKWNDEQKRRFFDHIVLKSKPKHLAYARDLIRERVPPGREDFTRALPRVISIYIFSYLDPRSLSRCTQVSWHWKYIAELDQLWMPKCLRLGWCISFTPSPYETGVWKRNYLQHIRSLRVLRPHLDHHTQADLENMKIKDEDPKKNSKKLVVPWRSSDPVPKDTWRYNVLENDDVVESISRMRRRKLYGTEAETINRTAKSKVNTGNNASDVLLRKSLSASKINVLASASTVNFDDRPQWARESTDLQLKNLNKSLNGTANVPRPAPVSSPPKRQKNPITARSARDPPTARLFPEQPWKVPRDDDED